MDSASLDITHARRSLHNKIINKRSQAQQASRWSVAHPLPVIYVSDNSGTAKIQGATQNDDDKISTSLDEPMDTKPGLMRSITRSSLEEFNSSSSLVSHHLPDISIQNTTTTIHSATNMTTSPTFPYAYKDTTNSRLLQAIRSRKRRESIGEVTARYKPSSSVVPRLTKSSTYASRHRSRLFMSSDSTIPIILPSIYPTTTEDNNNDNNNDNSSNNNNNNNNSSRAVHWDPHIDAFEILRAKITGITRTMQEFHVQELFRDELTERKRERHRTAPELHMRRSSSSSSSSYTIRFSPPPPPPPLPPPSYDLQHCHHEWQEWRQEQRPRRRVHSQGSIGDPSTETDHHPAHWNTDRDEDDLLDQEDEHPLDMPTSPNLTALFLTTNTLINSRLDELSETASITSSCDLNSSSAEWRSQFLDLMSACITQSEELESLSTEILGTERQVRELMVLNQTVHEQFRERERAYEDRIRECEDVAKQQLLMIDSLEELMVDLEMKMDQQQNQSEQDPAEEPSEQDGRWDFRQAVADILHLEEKDDLVAKIRWEVGMFVGGGVGTGHVIHTFEGQLNGIEMMIAGSGTTLAGDEEDEISNESYSISPTLKHARFHRHRYVLHITSEDRRKRFTYLPKHKWVPDHTAQQCQFNQNSKRGRTYAVK
ncbi:hypothetical protein EC973_001619 [Apophysomyces ossiformis]|uniref:Uncharacterized protein n=1 Tax=Apophysomyces ossiformis TaxID=679940 RepID=A0A8H7BYI4_9FUNG|nr:hypothetical protein EC973_001619 [Apophysomyces ossiformis]